MAAAAQRLSNRFSSGKVGPVWRDGAPPTQFAPVKRALWDLCPDFSIEKSEDVWNHVSCSPAGAQRLLWRSGWAGEDRAAGEKAASLGYACAGGDHRFYQPLLPGEVHGAGAHGAGIKPIVGADPNVHNRWSICFTT